MLFIGFSPSTTRQDIRSRIARAVGGRFTHAVIADLWGNTLHVAPPCFGFRGIVATDWYVQHRSTLWASVPASTQELTVDSRSLTCVQAVRRTLAIHGVYTPWCLTVDGLYERIKPLAVNWFTYDYGTKLCIADPDSARIAGESVC